jgi:hypothetical protein
MDKFLRRSPSFSSKGLATKHFFFGKKKQKTFVSAAHLRGGREYPSGVERGAKVFWFFFSKKKCFLHAFLSLEAVHLVAL